MKQNKTFKKIIKSILPLLLVLLVVNSCSKEELDFTEDEQNVTDIDVFSKSNASVQLTSYNKSASTTQGTFNNIDDNSATSRWSTKGRSVSAYFDFGSVVTVDFINMAFYKGNQRKSTFSYWQSNNGTSWTYRGRKTSNGNTDGLQEFDLNNITARYFRIKFQGNEFTEWNSVRDLEIFGTPATNSNGGGNGTAAGVLNGLQNWKLNAYTGNLNVSNSNDNGLNYDDSASKNDNNDWFYESNGYAYFKCYPGNPTSTNNTQNPRSELRELTSNGSTEINWDGTTNTEHSMKWKVRIDDLPPSGKVCFGQIHAESGSQFDDVIRVQVQGSSGQNSGEVDLRINGYVTEELLGSGQTISNFTFNMDTEYYFELTMRNEVVRLYSLNSNGTRNSTLFTSGDVDSDGNYFKAGCYLQSTQSSHHSSNTFGLVGIKELTVSH